MKIKYVGGNGPVVIAATGQTVEPDGVADVSDELAGSAPTAEHPGSGLLAQFDTWVIAPKAKPSPKDGE